MSTALIVASLVLEARKDASLHEAVVQTPRQVAQNKHLPEQVTETAAFVLRKFLKTENGIWM